MFFLGVTFGTFRLSWIRMFLGAMLDRKLMIGAFLRSEGEFFVWIEEIYLAILSTLSTTRTILSSINGDSGYTGV